MEVVNRNRLQVHQKKLTSPLPENSAARERGLVIELSTFY
jgi:hypothetical protein